SLGVRGTSLDRWPAARTVEAVEVEGHPIRVKVSPGRVKDEHDDAASVARRTGRPLREVLVDAEAAARAEHADAAPSSAPGADERYSLPGHPPHEHHHHDHDHPHDDPA